MYKQSHSKLFTKHLHKYFSIENWSESFKWQIAYSTQITETENMSVYYEEINHIKFGGCLVASESQPICISTCYPKT
jgi:hypothetical protein